MKIRYMKKTEMGNARKDGCALSEKNTIIEKIRDTVKSPVCYVPVISLIAAFACNPQARKVHTPVVSDEIIVQGEIHGGEAVSGTVPFITNMLAEGKTINEIIKMLESQDQSGSLELMEPEKSVKEKYGMTGLVVYQLSLEELGVQDMMELMVGAGMSVNDFSKLLCSFVKDDIAEFENEKEVVASKYGAEGLSVYLLIDGKRTAEDIMDELGISESKILHILDFMKDEGLIRLDHLNKGDVVQEVDSENAAKTYDLSGISLTDIKIHDFFLASDSVSLGLAYALTGENAKAKKIAYKLLKQDEDGYSDFQGAAEIFIELKDKAGIKKCINEIEKNGGNEDLYALAMLYKALYDIEPNDAEKAKMKEKALEALNSYKVEPAGSSGFDMSHSLEAVKLYKDLDESDKVKQILKESEQAFEEHDGISKVSFSIDMVHLYQAAGYEEKARKLAVNIPNNAKEILDSNPGGFGKGLFDLYIQLGLYNNALKILEDPSRSIYLGSLDMVSVYIGLAKNADTKESKETYLIKIMKIAEKQSFSDAGLIYAQLGLKKEALNLAEMAEAGGDFEGAVTLFLVLGEKKRAVENIGMALWAENPPNGSIYKQIKDRGIGYIHKGWAGPVESGVGIEFLSEYAKLSVESGKTEYAKDIVKYLIWIENEYEEAAEISIQLNDRESIEQLLKLEAELDVVTVAKLKVALWGVSNQDEHRDDAFAYIYKRMLYGECEYDEDRAAMLDLFSKFGAEDVKMVLELIPEPEVSDIESFYSYSRLLRIAGDVEATKQAAKKMEEEVYPVEALKAYTMAGAYDDAFRVAKTLVSEDLASDEALAIAGLISKVEPPEGYDKQYFADAVCALAKTLEEDPDYPEAVGVVKLYKLLGKKKDAIGYINELKEYEQWMDVAECYLALGMKAEALKYLKKAWKEEFEESKWQEFDEITIRKGG